MVPQPELERLLADHVARLGVPVRRGVEVTALEDTGDGVLVGTTAGPVRPRWLVGCDGGPRTVRRRAGSDFPGPDPGTKVPGRPWHPGSARPVRSW